MPRGDREKRKGERIAAALSVNVGGAKGVTRDVSASGIFFETEASYALGNLVNFTVDFNASGDKMLLKGRGAIVRLEQKGARVGVAVKIMESTMEMASDF